MGLIIYARFVEDCKVGVASLLNFYITSNDFLHFVLLAITVKFGIVTCDYTAIKILVGGFPNGLPIGQK